MVDGQLPTLLGFLLALWVALLLAIPIAPGLLCICCTSRVWTLSERNQLLSLIKLLISKWLTWHASSYANLWQIPSSLTSFLRPPSRAALIFVSGQRFGLPLVRFLAQGLNGNFMVFYLKIINHFLDLKALCNFQRILSYI